jgi:hypothetical protein
MRISPNGYLLSIIFTAAALLGCSDNSSSSLLGDGDGSGLAKAGDSGQASYERAPFYQPGLDEESLAYAASAPAAKTSVTGDFLNTGFEEESGACWNSRNASGMNSAGCGRYVNMGSRAFALSEGGISHGGGKAVQITYAKNEEFAGTDVGIDADTADVRAFYYFDKNFDFGQGMKIGRVSSFNPGTHLNDIDIILETRSAIGTNQCGISDMRDIGVYFNGAPRGSDWGNVSATMTFQREQWYAVEYQVVLNTPGRSDGSVRLWVDGVLKAEKTGLSIRGGMKSRLNTVKIGGWYSNGLGGNSCPNPAAPSRLYMDDVAISGSFIGMR